jgi:hypothetical protein
MDTTGPPIDVAALLERLSSRDIIDRLAELDRQARAWRVLLRASRDRERRQAPRPNPPAGGGGAHA